MDRNFRINEDKDQCFEKLISCKFLLGHEYLVMIDKSPVKTVKIED